MYEQCTFCRKHVIMVETLWASSMRTKINIDNRRRYVFLCVDCRNKETHCANEGNWHHKKIEMNER